MSDAEIVGVLITPSPEEARGLSEVLAVLDTIEEGGLLAALPVRAADRHRHEVAVHLLGILSRHLHRVASHGEAPPRRQRPRLYSVPLDRPGG